MKLRRGFETHGSRRRRDARVRERPEALEQNHDDESARSDVREPRPTSLLEEMRDDADACAGEQREPE